MATSARAQNEYQLEDLIFSRISGKKHSEKELKFCGLIGCAEAVTQLFVLKKFKCDAVVVPTFKPRHFHVGDLAVFQRDFLGVDD